MDATPSHPDFESSVGLCSVCRYARIVRHPRGGFDYRMCQLSESDSNFNKFPPLPVQICSGFEDN